MNPLTVDTLRAQGLEGHDPVRFRYLEALSRRLAGQPEAVQRLLAQRLHEALTAYVERAQEVATPRSDSDAHPLLAPSPLAVLNQELQARAQAEAERAGTDVGAAAVELNSARQFAEVWSKIAAERQVAEALDRGPENAGPLNPHRLMLRSLSCMRGLSPDYLRRFLAHMDALLWLEQAQMQARPQRAPLKPARGGRSSRSARG